MRQALFQGTKRMILKVGTSVLGSGGGLDEGVIEALARDIALVRSRQPGLQIILVSSGAIACGMRVLGLSKRPAEIQKLQALAAVGQRSLMQMYDAAFGQNGMVTAQMLLTWEDIGSRKRYENTVRTLNQILEYGALPVINENDTVATEEIQFGDNDQLSAMVAMLFEADLLVILSDSNGLYADVAAGQASRIPVVDHLNARILGSVRDSKNAFTKGGMASKLEAIKKAVRGGIPCVLADGKEKRVLSRVLEGEDIGTVFLSKTIEAATKKKWLSYILRRRKNGK